MALTIDSAGKVSLFVAAAAVALILAPGSVHAEMGATVSTDAFSLNLPAGYSEFAKQEQVVKTPTGPMNQVTYVSKSPSGEACIVTYGEMSGPILDPKAMMTSGRDGLVKSLGATIEAEKELEIDGNKGMTFLYSAAQPRPIFARTDMVVSGARLYNVIYIGPSAEARANQDVDAIFSSFKLVSKAP
ncbi:MAG: hypothetical protein ACYC7A_10040 [Thermoanaerobaculia bacterium]